MNTLKLKKNAPSGTIVLSRPDKRNAINREMLDDLVQAFDDFHGEKTVRAVILTGAGSAFCAGMDLAEMQQTAQEPDAWRHWHADAIAYRDLLERMLQFPKPIIAAVNGPVVAGGVGLLAACDLAVAAGNATFALPEPRRGIVAGIVAPLLVFRVGAAHAANLLLTARTISAADAQRIGLIHELVEAELTWVRAHELAQEIAHSAPEAIQLTKKLLNETVGEQLGTMLSAGAAASATARTTEAAAEGLAAFLEKRSPNWQ
jgi:enoyl-CoA hydratase/carnithine racemase